jgi:hypothetical protein
MRSSSPSVALHAVMSRRTRTQGETLSYLACHILDDLLERHGTRHMSVGEAGEYVSCNKLEKYHFAHTCE